MCVCAYIYTYVHTYIQLHTYAAAVADVAEGEAAACMNDDVICLSVNTYVHMYS